MTAQESGSGLVQERPRRRTLALAPVQTAALAFLGVVVALAVLGPLMLPHGPNAAELNAALIPPVGFGGDARHPLGTDELGRDELSRLASGARTSLLLALMVVAGSGVLGVVIGSLAGSCDGWVDAVVRGVIDLFVALPLLLVAVAVAGRFELSFLTLWLTLVLMTWTVFARLVRGELLRLRRAEFVLAARAVGCGPVRIALVHALPHLFVPLIVVTSFQLSTVIMIEASMSFLHLGVPPPAVSWGGMLADGRDYIGLARWLVLVPATAIGLTCLAVNITADWLSARLSR